MEGCDVWKDEGDVCVLVNMFFCVLVCVMNQ